MWRPFTYFPEDEENLTYDERISVHLIPWNKNQILSWSAEMPFVGFTSFLLFPIWKVSIDPALFRFCVSGAPAYDRLMISIQNLTQHHEVAKARKTNGPNDTAPPPALDNVSFSVPAGNFAVIIGPNGSGKSTLFHILSGMLRPSSGTASVKGTPCASQAARKSLGIVFQAPALDKILTVRENLKFFGQLHGIIGKAFSKRLDEVMDWTQISDRLDDPVGTLSGGQQRQAELAKSLIPSPPVLLLDEPTTGLDITGRIAFQKALLRLRDETGLTILMTTHVFDEASAADQVLILDQGHLIAEGTPRELCDTLGTEMITIQCKNSDPLASAELSLKLRHLGFTNIKATAQDIRISDLSRGDAVSAVGKIMDTCNSHIATIAIKQPTLDDVFLSLTSQTSGGAQ